MLQDPRFLCQPRRVWVRPAKLGVNSMGAAKVFASQSCPTLCNLMDCRPQAPLSMGFSRGSSQTRDRTRVSHGNSPLPSKEQSLGTIAPAPCLQSEVCSGVSPASLLELEPHDPPLEAALPCTPVGFLSLCVLAPWDRFLKSLFQALLLSGTPLGAAVGAGCRGQEHRLPG